MPAVRRQGRVPGGDAGTELTLEILEQAYERVAALDTIKVLRGSFDHIEPTDTGYRVLVDDTPVYIVLNIKRELVVMFERKDGGKGEFPVVTPEQKE